jgi:hypothetical protein
MPDFRATTKSRIDHLLIAYFYTFQFRLSNETMAWDGCSGLILMCELSFERLAPATSLQKQARADR